MSKKFEVPIQLPADPANALEAATKQYVDAKAVPIVCTSTTRPTPTTNGVSIYESDTGNSYVWYSAAWRPISSLNVLDEGVGTVTGTNVLNFVGSGVTVTTSVGNQATVTIPENKTQSGSLTGINVTSLQTQTGSVVFPVAFATAPIVVAYTTHRRWVANAVGNPITSGFDFRVQHCNDLTTHGDTSIGIYWIAHA